MDIDELSLALGVTGSLCTNHEPRESIAQREAKSSVMDGRVIG